MVCGRVVFLIQLRGNAHRLVTAGVFWVVVVSNMLSSQQLSQVRSCSSFGKSFWCRFGRSPGIASSPSTAAAQFDQQWIQPWLVATDVKEPKQPGITHLFQSNLLCISVYRDL